MSSAERQYSQYAYSIQQQIDALEKEKKILPEASFSLCETDPKEIAYKKNIELISDDLLNSITLSKLV